MSNGTAAELILVLAMFLFEAEVEVRSKKIPLGMCLGRGRGEPMKHVMPLLTQQRIIQEMIHQ